MSSLISNIHYTTIISIKCATELVFDTKMLILDPPLAEIRVLADSVFNFLADFDKNGVKLIRKPRCFKLAMPLQVSETLTFYYSPPLLLYKVLWLIKGAVDNILVYSFQLKFTRYVEIRSQLLFLEKKGKKILPKSVKKGILVDFCVGCIKWKRDYFAATRSVFSYRCRQRKLND